MACELPKSIMIHEGSTGMDDQREVMPSPSTANLASPNVTFSTLLAVAVLFKAKLLHLGGRFLVFDVLPLIVHVRRAGECVGASRLRICARNASVSANLGERVGVPLVFARL